MGRVEWFRRTTWTPQDAAECQSRLSRSRGDAGKAQYLRIQAVHLAEVGNHKAALSLIEHLLTNHRVEFELAATYIQRAESCAALGDDEEAVVSFRRSLAAKAKHPGVRPGVELAFAWFIALGRRVELYGEVEGLLRQYEGDGLTFPVERFKCAVVRALIAAEQGRHADAKAFA